MRNKNYLGSILALAILMAIGLACSGHGTKLEFNGGDLYYTDNVTESEAKKLGDYLVKEGFYDGKPKSVQLDKSGSTYQFRMVVQPERQNDEATMTLMKTFAGELSSDLFNDAPVEVHACDEQLKTLRVIKQ
jgi:preprotein translocase subunit SecF